MIPVSATLKAVSPDPIEHVTRITLLRGMDRVVIDNEIVQNFGETHEWGFGFNLDVPDVWHEETGAVVRAKTSGAGGHYGAEH